MCGGLVIFSIFLPENQSLLKALFLGILILLPVFILPISVQSQNYFACGQQSGVWQYDTVFVDCDVQVPTGALLQIMPGTKVIFRGHYSLHVQGSIKALGTPADSIVFSVIDTTGFGNIHTTAGGWNGLRFEYTPIGNDSSLFSHCIFRYGKATGDSTNGYGGVVRALQTDKLAIRHTTFEKNYAFYRGAALYSFKTNIRVENCRFLRNHAGNDGMVYGYGGAIFFISTEPDISRCYFAYNSSTGIGGAAAFEFSRPLLMNCIFENNFSALGGAIGFLRSVADRPIANLLVRNNQALFFGGGIANITASPVMTNLTIVNNHASMGGGYYCNFEAHAKLYNSILWGNTSNGDYGSQVWIWDVNSMPEFRNSTVQYGVGGFGGSTFMGVYSNCTETDPQFVGLANGNYHLSASSPAINTGTTDLPSYVLPLVDLDELPRIMYGALDMGAYEYQGYVGFSDLNARPRGATVVPNPNTGNARLLLSGLDQRIVSMAIYAADGRLIGQYAGPWRVNNQIQLDQLLGWSGMMAGEYLLRIVFEDGSGTVARMQYQPNRR